MPVVITNHNVSLEYILDHKLNTLCKLIHMRITKDDSIFPFRAVHEFIEVTDGTTIERPFELRISHNQKELNALFAIDAFNSFSANVDVSFGYIGGEFDTFYDIAINSLIEPLPSELTSITATPGTKAFFGI